MLERILKPAVYRHELEQAVVTGYLPTRGLFVEVGAFEPFLLSQTAALEQRGWHGLLIEPVPAQAAMLRAHRRAQVVEVACGPPEQHGTTMRLAVAGALSNMRQERSEAPTIDVHVVTLDSVLREAGVTSIDFLSIDVEGLEIDVLRGFAQYQPRLILLEDFAENSTKHRFMRANDYKRAQRTGNNSWYVPDHLDFPISLFGHWQLLRKYYLARPLRTAKQVIITFRGKQWIVSPTRGERKDFTVP
jgi:FkbM family methyltransferase